jgi:putative transposase
MWRQETLRRPQKTKKRRRLPSGHKQRLRATTANEMWAIDFQFDATSDQRTIKLCDIVNAYTREALAIRVGRSCTADDVVEVIKATSSASAAYRRICARTMARSGSRGGSGITVE